MINLIFWGKFNFWVSVKVHFLQFFVWIYYSNCDYCVSDDRCGFCNPSGDTVGVCLPVDIQHSDIKSSTGFCSSESSTSSHNISNVEFNWSEVSCKTKYTMAPLVLMVIYLLIFSSGNYMGNVWVVFRFCVSSLGPKCRILSSMGKKYLCFHFDIC